MFFVWTVVVIMSVWFFVGLLREGFRGIIDTFKEFGAIARDYREGRRREARFQIALWVAAALIVAVPVGLLFLIAR